MQEGGSRGGSRGCGSSEASCANSPTITKPAVSTDGGAQGSGETDGTYGQKQGGVRGGQPLGPPKRNWCTQGQIRSAGYRGGRENRTSAHLWGEPNSRNINPVRRIANIAICGASPTRVTYETDGTCGQKQGGVEGGSAFGPPMRGGWHRTHRADGGGRGGGPLNLAVEVTSPPGARLEKRQCGSFPLLVRAPH